MKTLIATAAIALSVSAPAFADVTNPQAFFALGNDSAAERTLGGSSIGDTKAVKVELAMYNDSAAEIDPTHENNATRADAKSLISFFAMGNDSAAETNR